MFGSADDSDRQHTGINFEKYDDIPVEASGHECPEGITTVSTLFYFYNYSSISAYEERERKEGAERRRRENREVDLVFYSSCPRTYVGNN